MSVSTIKKIKQRNLELLTHIKHRIIEKDAETAARILHKSHRLLEKRLDRALLGDDDVPLKDLIGVSKEMFYQSQIEKNKPTAIFSNSGLTKEHDEALRMALKNDDTVAMLELIFPKHSETDTQSLINPPLDPKYP